MQNNKISNTSIKPETNSNDKPKKILPHPIPSLEIMNEMVYLARNNQEIPSLENIAFIGAQHKLETTASLFQAMILLGAKPKNMFFTGKCYSTSPTVEESIRQLGVNIFDDPMPQSLGTYAEACTEFVQKMWMNFNEHLTREPTIEKIIILDDGGKIIKGLNLTTILNYQVVVIEQTRGGLYSKELSDHGIFPIISVAQSAAKKIIEAPFIVTAILNRFKKVVADLGVKTNIYGVIGNGSIGSKVANYLAEIGQEVIVFDQEITAKTHPDVKIVDNIEEIFKKCSFIFGCTGKDITPGINFEAIIERDQVWISGSSEDREFNSFLRNLPKDYTNTGKEFNLADDIIFTFSSGATITIKQGGFPFNFDREPWNVPASDIEITQCCLLGAVIQAAIIKNRRITDKIIEPQQQLDAHIQAFIVKLWGNREIKSGKSRLDQDLFNMFKVPDLIIEKSGKASAIDIKILKDIFSEKKIDRNFSAKDPSVPSVSMRNFMTENYNDPYNYSLNKDSLSHPIISEKNKFNRLPLITYYGSHEKDNGNETKGLVFPYYIDSGINISLKPTDSTYNNITNNKIKLPDSDKVLNDGLKLNLS